MPAPGCSAAGCSVGFSSFGSHSLARGFLVGAALRLAAFSVTLAAPSVGEILLEFDLATASGREAAGADAGRGPPLPPTSRTTAARPAEDPEAR